jgi:hypothetical protein
MLVHRDVDTGDTCHCCLPSRDAAGKNAAFYSKMMKNHPVSALALLVALVGADDVDDAPAAHDLAVLADLLD